MFYRLTSNQRRRQASFDTGIVNPNLLGRTIYGVLHLFDRLFRPGYSHIHIFYTVHHIGSFCEHLHVIIRIRSRSTGQRVHLSPLRTRTWQAVSCKDIGQTVIGCRVESGSSERAHFDFGLSLICERRSEINSNRHEFITHNLPHLIEMEA